MFHEQVGMLDETVGIVEISNISIVYVSEFVRKCFPVCQEVVGIKKRPDIEF